MSGPLDGKVALITGASRGIGAATPRDLSAAVAAVALAGLVEATLEEVVRSLPEGNRSLMVAADMAELSDLDRLVDQVSSAQGGIDILVNNAGFYPDRKQIYKVEVDECQYVMYVNPRAPWWAIPAAVAAQVRHLHLARS